MQGRRRPSLLRRGARRRCRFRVRWCRFGVWWCRFRSRPSFSLVLGGTLTRHRGEVTACAYSPDGTRLATCDANREVLVWDPSKAVVVVDKMGTTGRG